MYKKLLLFILCLFILTNIAIIDWKIFFNTQPPAANQTPFCPDSCIENIKSEIQKISTNSSNAMPDSLVPKPSPSPVPTLTSLPKNNSINNSVKEIYIPLGQGTFKALDWTDMSGVESYIDLNNYLNIKNIYFEASLRIPTANGYVYARLYNVTGKHPTWNSEVKTLNPAGTLVVSEPISLDPGNNLYRVQIKTDMGYDSYLDFARVKIILK